MYRVPDRVRTTRDHDGGIALHIDSGHLFRLNPVGALILESLGKGLVEAEIAKEVAREYSISEETAITDIDEFLKVLEDHHLVQGHQEGRAS